MEYETTGRLENMLRQINSESGARQFVNEHTGGNGRKTFSSYMNEMIAQKNLELKGAIREEIKSSQSVLRPSFLFLRQIVP